MPSANKQPSISHVLSFPHRLQNTLTFYYLFPILILFIILSGYFYFTTKHSLDDELGKRLDAISKITADKVKPVQLLSLELAQDQGQTFDVIQNAFDQIIQTQDIQRIYILNSSGKILLDTRDKKPSGKAFQRFAIHKTELQKAFQGQTTASTLFKGLDGYFYKTSFSPITSGQQPPQAVVGIDGNAVFFKNLRNLEKRLIGLGVFFIMMILLISFLLSQKIVTPIEQLAVSAKTIGDGQLERNISITSKNEIGFLGFVMEEMRNKILERDERLQVMLRGIAHEIRNPLGGIELFAGLLKEDIETENSKEKINKIIGEARNLQKLVDDFLNFAKTPQIQKTDINLSDFFKQIAFFWEARLAKNNINLCINPSDIKTIQADEEKLKRMLHNLIENAEHAFENEPDEKIISISTERKQHHILFLIQDTGDGMSQNTIEKLFQPFFTTKKFGNGLGLAMVKKIVHAHGGDIDVQSQPKNGTTFWIMLPTPFKQIKPSI